jgi:hypothetical protein
MAAGLGGSFGPGNSAAAGTMRFVPLIRLHGDGVGDAEGAGQKEGFS